MHQLMFTTPSSAPDRCPLYVRSVDDFVVLAVSALAPPTRTRQEIHLAVTGELDFRNAAGLRDVLTRLLRRHRPVRVSIDLAGVTSMDASGVLALQRSAAAAAQVDTAITVVDPPAGTVEALEATGLLDVLQSHTRRECGVRTRTGSGGRPAAPRRDGRLRDPVHATCRTGGSMAAAARSSGRNPA